MLRTDSLQRRNGAVQHVVDAVIGLGLFDGGNVRRLFHHAHQALVAGRARTIAAWINIRDIATYRAKMKFFFKVADGCGQSFSVLAAGPENVEGHALRALAAYPGKFLEFVDESSHGLGKLSHDLRLYSPGSPKPPSIPPTVDCIASSTFCPAAFTAAVTRSWSISTSPVFTTSGSMWTASTCFLPFILTVTVPPPAEASTTVCCILSCNSWACF